VVNGDVEITLDLRGVQVHGNDTVGAGCGEHIRDQFGTNGHPGPVFPVLAGKAIIRDHGNHLISRSPFCGIDHQEQFHQVVGGRISTLDQEYKAAADAFLEFHVDLPVTETLDIDLPQRFSELFGDLFR